MAAEKKAVDLGLLEEDDEFEEFPTEDWDTKEEDESDVNVWEDNWDDDTVEDDFSIQLSKINRKRSISQSPMSTNGNGREPSAKKVCARESSHPAAAVVKNAHTNGTKNGHSAVSDDVTMCDGDANDENSSRGRSSRLSRQSSKTDDESSNESRTPTRASARLRSTKK